MHLLSGQGLGGQEGGDEVTEKCTEKYPFKANNGDKLGTSTDKVRQKKETFREHKSRHGDTWGTWGLVKVIGKMPCFQQNIVPKYNSNT